MSKTKSKDHNSELQRLRQEIRELTKRCRQQERLLTKYQKQEHFYDDVRDEVEELIAIKEETAAKADLRIPCTTCRDGYYDSLFEALDKIYGSCNSCGHRKRLK